MMNEVKLSGPAIEEWLNTVLRKVVEDDSVPGKFSKGGPNQPPAQALMIDLQSLEEHGLTPENARRIQRNLYVYSIGFHQQLRSITNGCKNRTRLLLQLWKAYSLILEQCIHSDYKFLIVEVAKLVESEQQ